MVDIGVSLQRFVVKFRSKQQFHAAEDERRNDAVDQCRNHQPAAKQLDRLDRWGFGKRKFSGRVDQDVESYEIRVNLWLDLRSSAWNAPAS